MGHWCLWIGRLYIFSDKKWLPSFERDSLGFSVGIMRMGIGWYTSKVVRPAHVKPQPFIHLS